MDTPAATTPPLIQEPAIKPSTKPGKKVEITINRMKNGAKVAETVTAYTTSVQGLVINKYGKEWVITHQASGFHLGTWFRTKALALEMANIAPRSVDWTVDADKLRTIQEANDYAKYTLKGGQPPKQKQAS